MRPSGRLAKAKIFTVGLFPEKNLLTSALEHFSFSCPAPFSSLVLTLDLKQCLSGQEGSVYVCVYVYNMCVCVIYIIYMGQFILLTNQVLVEGLFDVES